MVINIKVALCPYCYDGLLAIDTHTKTIYCLKCHKIAKLLNYEEMKK
jgi:hypothetical protein